MPKLARENDKASPSGCLGRESPPRRISLIAPVTAEQEWSWNASHRSAPVHLECADADGNLFGLKAATGGLKMWFDRGLHVTVRLDELQKRGFIIGYPEVIYGYKPFGPTVSLQSPLLQLPIPVKDIPNLWCVAEYSIKPGIEPGMALDLAYDLWLTREWKPVSIKKGDVELMIWIYHHNLKAAGALIRDFGTAIPANINGTVRNLHWVTYLSNVDAPDRTSILLSFVLDEDGADTPEDGGISEGTVGVNLREILNHASALIRTSMGWNETYVNSLYVNDIELGAEFGTKAARVNFDWSLWNYSLVLDPQATR